ncbi:crossover junction endodeoxyribonuclease RuvC [Corynebacterium sp. 153RC1]|uniref:crossover junction endodeoxyribonuclease RuvC n=1 Tax=Corynebacterium TaxID=1716 RepID=UPI00211D04FB|nr:MULTISPECIES: crossover junction endodeoxyribonuclease RuvC [unclassified Corynebacterium]MCQ9369651.1 crossover junction endodeoxyribonuclease RuvC [Corynebacterium sp. 35RC1]MCQ9342509.1 crossover junction endodeoxyribonuclease RuvC [Corynebacterium sp. 76QC2CO]MCQ9351503.1 crossover junction endodeoxyribonuclease RuvC [Corynebacterium sp. 209RC1]MCQ9354632.1 crossover junction endodeoxyribonuclease RuvC [Corynebacterium sp. 1222RC1]MCQ9357516.1 crossover junction endodeoxyribonuclease Ru
MNIQGLRVMGIDPGLTRCGLSVVQAGRGRQVIPVAVGVVRTEVGGDLPDRLLDLSNAVNDWMDEYRPDVVAIERIFERGNVSTVMHTAHGVGVLVLAAAQRGIPVHMYTPSEVKKAISGNGRADKKQMTAMITRILGLGSPPKPADAADALALAVCHCWRAPLIHTQKIAHDQAQRQQGKLGKAKQQLLAAEKEQRKLHSQTWNTGS